jgi:hypothetical protein
MPEKTDAGKVGLFKSRFWKRMDTEKKIGECDQIPVFSKLKAKAPAEFLL